MPHHMAGIMLSISNGSIAITKYDEIHFLGMASLKVPSPDFLTSHPEDAVLRLLDGRVQAGAEGQSEDASRLGRVEDAVVPEAGGGIVGIALAFVLVEDGLHEFGALLVGHLRLIAAGELVLLDGG